HSDGTLLDTSTSGIDNVEVVTITARPYDAVIKVYSASSSFSRVSFEPYGLSTPPGFVFPDTLPSPGSTIYRVGDLDNPRLVAFLNNTGDFNAHQVEADISLPTGSQVVGGLQHSVANILPRNTSRNRAITWQLAPGSGQTGTVALNLASTSYGESFTGNDSFLFQVTPRDF